MKVGRRFVVLLAAVLAVVLTLVGGRAAPNAQASTKAGKVVIWTDSYRKAAVRQVTNTWARARSVDVDVVVKDFGKIRDDLKTVAAADAPDVIVGAHDWTGQLAADGSVVAVFPTRPQGWVPGLCAEGHGVQRPASTAIPTQLENVGLVVNTGLVKLPKTFAQLEKSALAYKRGARTLGIAVPQGSGGDAYHMYPFFSGLGGYVFGPDKAGNPQSARRCEQGVPEERRSDRQVEP